VAGVTRQIALLRGINVGRNNRIAMSDLRLLMGGLGYGDVRTHLVSGNAILTSSKKPEHVARELEQAIDAELCPGVKVLVRTRAELAKVIADNPLPEAATDGSKFLLLFLSAEPDLAGLGNIETADFAPEEFRAGDREIYLWCPGGIQDSRLNKAVAKQLSGVSATARNWNTVTKLLELAGT